MKVKHFEIDYNDFRDGLTMVHVEPGQNLTVGQSINVGCDEDGTVTTATVDSYGWGDVWLVKVDWKSMRENE